MRAAAGTDDHGLCAEHIEVTITHMKTDRAGDPVGYLRIHQQMRDHDPVVHLGRGFPRGFRDDRLVALAVNHDLPLAFA